MTDQQTKSSFGFDAAAIKPTEVDIHRAKNLHVDDVIIDFEGVPNLPSPEKIARLAEDTSVKVTIPVRADGFDPLGDNALYESLPTSVGIVLVAGHPAYLEPHERSRAIAPRIGKLITRNPDAWIGTEGIELIALAAGGTQFLLLTPNTESHIQKLRSAGFTGDIAIYAPTVVSTNEEAVLEAIGPFVARRGAVRQQLHTPINFDNLHRTDRDILLSAINDYAITGSSQTVSDRINALKQVGADYVVGYPATGISAFTEP